MKLTVTEKAVVKMTNSAKNTRRKRKTAAKTDVTMLQIVPKKRRGGDNAKKCDAMPSHRNNFET